MNFKNWVDFIFWFIFMMAAMALIVIVATGQPWWAIVIAALHCIDSASEVVFVYAGRKFTREEKQKAEQARLERLKYFN